MGKRITDSPSVARIYKLDRRIRYAGIISSDGNVLEGGMRQGLEMENLDPPELRLKRVQQFRTSRALADEWSAQYGKFSYSMIAFDKIMLFVFPLDEDRTLFVSVASSIRRSNIERVLLDFLNISTL